MNSMSKHSVSGIFISLLLVFSVFTLLSISEVNAAETISVNAEGYENTTIIEFENESASKIKTIRIWAGGEITFESFKSEPGWGGGKYSDGKLLVFTATNTLSPGESIKFGLVTDEKVNAMNWKVLDLNEQPIDQGKISIQKISETTSSFIEEESEQVEQAKETGGDLYGTKKFIPEQIRVGSDIRLVGNGFVTEQTLKFYLDDIILKSVKTDEQGNFLTTISIPKSVNTGTSEFIIKDESGDIQSTNVNIKDPNNRFLKTSSFNVSEIPGNIAYGETLSIGGSAYPQSAVLIMFENTDRVLEKARVITANSNGEWVFEEIIDRTENLGEKYVIITNDHNKTTKSLMVKSGNLIEVSTSAIRYNSGEVISITGNAEASKDTTIWIKDENKKIVLYDVFKSSNNGMLNYQSNVDDVFPDGTYSVTIKQGDMTDATLFGINKYPKSSIIVLLDKTNFSLNSKATLGIIGPSSTKLSIKVLDSNDQIKINESVTTTSLGKIKYALDLSDLSSGIYRAVVSASNIQDSVKFSIGLEPGSGDISLITTKKTFSPGESILIIGHTGNDARLIVTLKDPSNNVSSEVETFSDGSGNFSTDQIGIPANAELGTWKITVHSRLDTKSIDINVNVPLEKGLTLKLEQTEFEIGDTITIKGIGYSDSGRLQIDLINNNGETVVTLETPITSDGTFSVPWVIPNNIGTGIFTVTVSDAENTDSVEIDIQ